MTSSAAHGSAQAPRAWRWRLPIVIVTAALYARTVGFGWVYDDQMDVLRNGFVKSFRYLPEIFSTTVWAGSGMETYLYRPLVLLSYAANHAVSGLEPWSYHLVNVALHALVAVLVFQLGLRWGLAATAAGVGGLLFAVHPVHVEVVANVAGRKDLLAAVFVLGAVLAHRRALDRGGNWLVLPVVLYLCAMLSKEVGAAALLLIAAQDVYMERDRRAFVQRRRLHGLYVGYLGALVLFMVVRLRVTGVLGVPDTFVFDNPLVAESILVRWATALAVLGKGFSLLLVPVTLSPDYSFNAIPVVETPVDPRLLGTLAGVGCLLWGLSVPAARRSVLPMAVAWYVLAVLPGSNLLVTVGTIFGERLLYLPSVALCLAIGAGMAWLLTHHRLGAVLALTFVTAALSAQTLRYSGAWTGDITLFEWATESVPRSTKAHHKLGEEYLRVGRLGEALRSLNRALTIAPDNAFAVATLDLARQQIAARYLPGSDGSPAPEEPPPNAEILYAVGQGEWVRGNLAAARARWEAALTVDPTHGPSMGDLGAAQLAQGDTAAATATLEQAVRVAPDIAGPWFNLATVHLAKGREHDAAAALHRFLDAAGRGYPEQVAWAHETLARLEGR